MKKRNTHCIICGKQLTKSQQYHRQQCCSTSCSAKNENKYNKMKKTCKKKYGVEHFSKSKKFSEKIRNTWNNKSKEEIKAFNESCEKTHFERYGCKRPLQKKQFKQKVKQTNLEKYGVENPFQVDSIKDKIKETNVKKYGVDNPRKSSQILNKSKESYKKRFIKILIEKMKNYAIPMFDENEYDNIRKKYKWKCVKCGSVFEQNIHKNQINGKIQHIPRCLNCYPHLSGYSFLEKELVDFIKSIYDGRIITNNRKILKGKELDIYLPEINIAVQFDGIYWHSLKDKNYHLNKTLLCEKQGIQLIHVFEHEWINKREIVEDRIKSILKIEQKCIFARKCDIKEIDKNTASEFLSRNPLQGYVDSSIRYGLYFEDELVFVMTFRKSRKNGSYDYELTRFASKMGVCVVGGVSRLLTMFKRNYKGSLVSYADRRYCNDELYKKLGFELICQSKPKCIKIDKYQIFDCGNLIYVMK